jgi:hypothetical protein
MTTFIKLGIQILALFVALMALEVCGLAQDTSSIAKVEKGCGSIKLNPLSRTDKPLVWGEPYTVPAIELKVVDDDTGQTLADKKVVVHYSWRWVEFPESSNPESAWSRGGEIVQCVTDEKGAILLPSHKVEPRGWYDGNLLKGRKPNFHGMSVEVYIDTHIIAKDYSVAEIDDLRKEKKVVILFPVN